VLAILGVMKRVPAPIPAHYVLRYPAVAYNLIHSVNFVFGSKSDFKDKYQTRTRFELMTPGSDRVQI